MMQVPSPSHHDTSCWKNTITGNRDQPGEALFNED